MEQQIFTSISVNELQVLIEKSVSKVLKKKPSSTQEEEHDYIDIKEASVYTHIAVATLYDYTHKKKIPFHKVGKKLLFSKKELYLWIKEKRKKTQDEIDEEASNWLIKNK